MKNRLIYYALSRPIQNLPDDSFRERDVSKEAEDAKNEEISSDKIENNEVSREEIERQEIIKDRIMLVRKNVDEITTVLSQVERDILKRKPEKIQYSKVVRRRVNFAPDQKVPEYEEQEVFDAVAFNRSVKQWEAKKAEFISFSTPLLAVLNDINKKAKEGSLDEDTLISLGRIGYLTEQYSKNKLSKEEFGELEQMGRKARGRTFSRRLKEVSGDTEIDEGGAKSGGETELRADRVKAEKTLAVNRTDAVKAEEPLTVNRTDAVNAEESLAVNRTDAVNAEEPLAVNRTDAVNAEEPLTVNRTDAVNAEEPLAVNRTDAVNAEEPLAVNETVALPLENPESVVVNEAESAPVVESSPDAENSPVASPSTDTVEAKTSTRSYRPRNRRQPEVVSNNENTEIISENQNLKDVKKFIIENKNDLILEIENYGELDKDAIVREVVDLVYNITLISLDEKSDKEVVSLVSQIYDEIKSKNDSVNLGVQEMAETSDLSADEVPVQEMAKTSDLSADEVPVQEVAETSDLSADEVPVQEAAERNVQERVENPEKDADETPLPTVEDVPTTDTNETTIQSPTFTTVAPPASPALQVAPPKRRTMPPEAITYNTVEKQEESFEQTEKLIIPERFSNSFVLEDGVIFGKINGVKNENIRFPVDKSARIESVREATNGLTIRINENDFLLSSENNKYNLSLNNAVVYSAIVSKEGNILTANNISQRLETIINNVLIGFNEVSDDLIPLNLKLAIQDGQLTSNGKVLFQGIKGFIRLSENEYLLNTEFNINNFERSVYRLKIEENSITFQEFSSGLNLVRINTESNERSFFDEKNQEIPERLSAKDVEEMFKTPEGRTRIIEIANVLISRNSNLSAYEKSLYRKSFDDLKSLEGSSFQRSLRRNVERLNDKIQFIERIDAGFEENVPERFQGLKLAGSELLFQNRIPLLTGLTGAKFKEENDNLLILKANGETTMISFSREALENFRPYIFEQTDEKGEKKIITAISDYGFSVPIEGKEFDKYFWDFKEISKAQFEEKYSQLSSIENGNGENRFDIRKEALIFKGQEYDMSSLSELFGFDYGEYDAFKSALFDGKFDEATSIASPYLEKSAYLQKIDNLKRWGIEFEDNVFTVNGKKYSIESLGGEGFLEDLLSDLDPVFTSRNIAQNKFYELMRNHFAKEHASERLVATASGVPSRLNEARTEIEKDSFNFEPAQIKNIKVNIGIQLPEELREEANRIFDEELSADIQAYIDSESNKFLSEFSNVITGKTAEEISRIERLFQTQLAEAVSERIISQKFKDQIDKISEERLSEIVFEREKRNFEGLIEKDKDGEGFLDDTYGNLSEVSRFGIARKVVENDLMDFLFTKYGAKKGNIPDLGLRARTINYVNEKTNLFSEILAIMKEYEDLLNGEKNLSSIQKLRELKAKMDELLSSKVAEAQNVLNQGIENGELNIREQRLKQTISFFEDLRSLNGSNGDKISTSARYSDTTFRRMGGNIKINGIVLNQIQTDELFREYARVFENGENARKKALKDYIEKKYPNEKARRKTGIVVN